MIPLPTHISTRVEESVNRILSAFDDAVQFGLVNLRLDEIKTPSIQ
ncbi:MAG: hypothetical protein GF381_02010 [Candidatus Pacebacteria bacterium]|nr:hypothetical protein [Candidatus Paceibacterota bacterium]